MVILTLGLAESGPDKARAQRELAARAVSGGLRLVGPNCLGVINTNPDVRLDAPFSCLEPLAGGVAVGVQSGDVGIALVEASRDLGLGRRTAPIGHPAYLHVLVC